PRATSARAAFAQARRWSATLRPTPSARARSASAARPARIPTPARTPTRPTERPANPTTTAARRTNPSRPACAPRGPPGTCTQTTNPCQATTGTCTSTGANTFACAFTNVANGTSCNTAGTCVTGQTCSAGACTGGTPFCPAGQSCNPTTPPVCVPSIVAPQVAKDLQISPPSAIAMDVGGAAYLAGSIFSLSPVSFDGNPVTSTGGADLFLAKYDPTTHLNSWARGYGDAQGNDQNGTGAAVTADGTLAVI